MINLQSQVTEKQCKQCLQTKLLADFHNHKNGKYGKFGKCKKCNITNTSQWYRDNLEKGRAKAKRWALANPERRHEIAYNSDLKARYGITIADYSDMFERQEGLCAICSVTTPGRGRKYFCVDHDHSTGKIRGLLCGACNDGLGKFRDSIDSLKLAVEYLERADF